MSQADRIFTRAVRAADWDCSDAAERAERIRRHCYWLRVYADAKREVVTRPRKLFIEFPAVNPWGSLSAIVKSIETL
jgi:hypothetical protein